MRLAARSSFENNRTTRGALVKPVGLSGRSVEGLSNKRGAFAGVSKSVLSVPYTFFSEMILRSRKLEDFLSKEGATNSSRSILLVWVSLVRSIFMENEMIVPIFYLL